MKSVPERALALLGSGISSTVVASTLGVTEGRISQLMSDEVFAQQVMELKYEALSKHNSRDLLYDEVEDTLIAKLKKSIPLLIRPTDILGAIRVINSAKRRGTDSQESLAAQKTVVNIVLPKVIAQEFTLNIDNQVIKTGDQDLLTMDSGRLLELGEAKDTRLPAPEEPVEENELLASL